MIRSGLVGLALAALAGPCLAQAAPCVPVVASVAAMTGLKFESGASLQDGWCVLDGSVVQAGAAEVETRHLRLRGEAAGAVLTRIELEADGVRLRPALGHDIDPTLRETLRLQTGALALVLIAGPEGVRLQGGRLRLSGGAELAVEADLAGAALAPAALALGRLTRLDLEWRNDGRILRPAIEAAGAALRPGALGPAAVYATRGALIGVADALPEELLDDASDKALDGLIAALPQGRGRLNLGFTSDSGIGAAQLGVLALSDKPAGPEALARLFAGSKLTVDWQPGPSE